MARREERAYRAYVSDEQHSQAGCIGVQSGTFIRGRVLSLVCGAAGSVFRRATVGRDIATADPDQVHERGPRSPDNGGHHGRRCHVEEIGPLTSYFLLLTSYFPTAFHSSALVCGAAEVCTLI